MLNALLISNNIARLTDYFVSNDLVTYTVAAVSKPFDPDLTPYDLLVVPNGSDHVAMLAIKDKVRAFLDAGKTVICADGWFTDWVPGNQWVMNNTKRTIEVRYTLKTDRYGLFDGVNVDDLTFSHGMSGWWSCGYVEPSPEADVLLDDTWGRAIVVLDETSTNGTLFLTASGPLADVTYAGKQDSALVILYRNLIRHIARQQQPTPTV
ncbi:hypothetical protein FAES_4581 [Fibrella aestuarina BUZ 2]|uniref:Glutamine amidotransferase domain-containing protein n=1 Tax=Fibrella aestuarina BUZ 2 TaxID=1166018 RepID=I0KEM7_9BACT|nr:hypothetical protein [Fibrella aestuarina]CCH02580.1 hypothetical protein FAES_4581 [Fibrella aestuarina BUZ 2]